MSNLEHTYNLLYSTEDTNEQAKLDRFTKSIKLSRWLLVAFGVSFIVLTLSLW